MKHLLVSALFVIAANLPGALQAQQQPSAADRTTARRLGNEGVVALKNGDFDTAADRFERANDLVNAPSFLVLLARARTGQGRLVEAYEIYRTIIREGVQPDKPEAFKRALAEAKAEVKLLEPRLAWVAVNVVGARPEQVEVTLNGSVIPSAALGAQRPADPGTLRIEAKAEGYRTAEKTLELAEGQHPAPIELRLEALPKPPEARVPVKMDQPVMTADGGEPGFVSQSTLGYVALGLGAAGLAVGTVTGILAINRRQDLDDFNCYLESGNTCYLLNQAETVNAAVSAKEDLDTFSTAATISFIAGGALTATGIILLVTAPDEPSSSQGASIRPFVGFGSVGAVGTF